MRHHRLSMVRGLINDKHPTYFVVDTGGEVISISTATAEDARSRRCRARSRCGLRHVGLGPRRVPAAGREPEVRRHRLPQLLGGGAEPAAPSVLLGFEVGGIVGHKFLSPYRVSLDLDRSELRMTQGRELDQGSGLEGSADVDRDRAGTLLRASRSARRACAWRHALPHLPAFSTTQRRHRLAACRPRRATRTSGRRCWSASARRS